MTNVAAEGNLYSNRLTGNEGKFENRDGDKSEKAQRRRGLGSGLRNLVSNSVEAPKIG